MEWIGSLHNTIVGLDTAPLIYLIEENPTYLPLVRPFFAGLDRGDFRVVTSVLTLTEVLVHPMRHGDYDLSRQYRRILLEATNLQTIPVSERIAEEAAQLRSRVGLRTPDAIHLATSICAGASYFLTNDERLPALAVGSLKILVLNRLLVTQP